MPMSDVRSLVQANQERSPFILRQRVEDGTMGRGLDSLAEAMATVCPEGEGCRQHTVATIDVGLPLRTVCDKWGATWFQ